MNWDALLGRLGNAADVMSGKESVNSIKRGNMADATANRQISSSDTQAAERNNLQKLMQKIQIAADTLSQGSQQGHQRELQFNALGSSGVQSQLDREQRERMQGADIGAQVKLAGINNTGALERTMAPLNFEQQLLKDSGYDTSIPDWMSEKLGVPTGISPRMWNTYGRAGVSAATATDPMMTKAFGNSVTARAEQEQMNMLYDRMFPGQRQQFQPGVGQVGPGGVPMRGPAAPSIRTPIAPRPGNY